VSVLSPVEIDSSIQYSQVAVGSDHSCALTNTGVVKCWGANTVGQLADGTSVAKSTPVIVDAGVTYTKIRTGTMQSCGMISGGYIKCWGYNGWGELGSISANARAATLVSEFGSVIDFYLKDSQTFLRASNGKIKVLGLDHYGQLGVGRQIFWPSPVAFD
jgi:alpha-tubulin suppressor-like RCC1 family protein